MVKHIPLTDNWQLKERNPAQSLLSDGHGHQNWLPASVPGTVHEALLAANVIPDPFYGLNENKVQWVGERDWWYRTTFELPADPEANEQLVLCCEGLDTFATIWLNGKQIAQSTNMFLPVRVAITQHLVAGQNELLILFDAALPHGKADEAIYGEKTAWCDGDPSRVYVRKAQYHYGWDWGPVLLTAGPWLPVRLEYIQARICDLHCPIVVAEDLTHAEIDVCVDVEMSAPLTDLRVRLTLYDPDQVEIATAIVALTDGQARHTFQIDQPGLWWPHGYGQQPLYKVTATLYQQDRELDQSQVRLGIRRLRLLQEPVAGEEGRSFLFEVNNTHLFCGGANWIPADMLLPRVTQEQYRAHLEMMVHAHMIMVRVWGGGIYESDYFYDLCDELGILVWQDFMFSCGIYPVHAPFLEQVRQEAQYQITRLRNHPSLVLWCGNNENQMIAVATKQASHKDGQLQYPDRVIYEELLSTLCAQLHSDCPYWPGSPYGGEEPGSALVGDKHTWEVWHGSTAPYQDYYKYWGRFVSEFGMEAAPSLHTLLAVIPPAERYPQSRTVEYHNKSADGARRLALYLIDNLRLPRDLPEYVYATRFIQAEAMAYAIRGWRRRFGRAGQRSVAGALVWQLNDCWPAISWAIIDSARRPKPAYYTMRRELAPLAIGLERQGTDLVLWGVNAYAQAISARIQMQFWGLDGTLLATDELSGTLVENGVTELLSRELLQEVPCIVSARLYQRGEIVARATLWPEPFKYLVLSDPGVTVEHMDDKKICVRTRLPAKGVWLDIDDSAYVQWSDNMLDLFPDDPQIVNSAGLAGRSVQVTCLT